MPESTDEREARTAAFLTRDPVTDNMFAQAEDLTTVIGEAVGAGSVCWESMVGTGVFQDQQARTIVEHAVRRVREMVDGARSDEIAEVERQRDRAEQIAEDRAEELNARDATAPQIMRTLEEDIRIVLNRHSAENGSNTPDFILAKYLARALEAGEELINERHKWWGLPDPWAKMLSDFTLEAEDPEAASTKVASIADRIADLTQQGEAGRQGPDAPHQGEDAPHQGEEGRTGTVRVPMQPMVIPPEDATAGELLELLGTDAQRWAWEFTRMRGVVADPEDQGWLIAWFANAIEAGRTAGYRARQQELEAEQTNAEQINAVFTQVAEAALTTESDQYFTLDGVNLICMTDKKIAELAKSGQEIPQGVQRLVRTDGRFVQFYQVPGITGPEPEPEAYAGRPSPTTNADLD